jgi:uncharacterized repeat protein (TIGR01451 family)
MSLFKLSLLLAVVMVLVSAASASAAQEGIGWEAFVQAYPTYLHPGKSGTVQIDVMNTGAEPSSGPVIVTDTLPAGVSAIAAGGMSEARVVSPVEEATELVPETGKERGGARWGCKIGAGGTGQAMVTCTSNPEFLNGLPVGRGEHFLPIERVGVDVQVDRGAAEGALENRVTIAGAGAEETAVVSSPITVSSSEPGYGFSGFDMWFTNADGTLDTQAGSHPYEMTTAVGFNELADGQLAGGEQRNLAVELPPGFSGEPNSAPRCTHGQLSANECSPETQIGEETPLFADERGGGSLGGGDLPVYNMAPPPGVVDQFATIVLGKAVFFDTAPRGYGRYDLVTRVNAIAAGVRLDGSILRLWGVASEPSHDRARWTAGPSLEDQECKLHGCSSSAPPRPFLSLPTSCEEGPQPFRIFGLGTWEDEGARAQAEVVSHNLEDAKTGFTGCSKLSFFPSLTTSLETSAADTPVGLGVNVTFPQEALRVPGRLIEAPPKNTTVTLPEGLVINPGQAAGLQACSATEAKLKEEGAPECSEASRVGSVKVRTPLLEGAFETELTGSVYVLAQSGGGPGELPNLQSHPPALQLLIAIEGDGIDLKIPANVQMNEANGQLTTTLTETPALPFTSFELLFTGTQQAALASPAGCGTYTTTSDFTPWSAPFDADLFPSSSFQITAGPGGGPCPASPLPFDPSLIAGATSDEAGAYTGFSLLLQRGDGQQRIEKLRIEMPKGLTAEIGSVSLCPEPQASAGECGSASQIGNATVASGPGQDPLVIPQPGNPESPIYLTGPYEGAPFGLSIVTHVIAGPFDLEKGTRCDCIVTRAKIEIDPLTAQIVVTTQPLPQIVDGIPTDLRLVNSVIDHEHFMLNPTDCDASSLTGTAWGTPPPGVGGPGASAPIETRFQVGSCQGLKFKPTFKVSTSAHSSRLRGASLHVTLALPDEAGLGTEANVQKVKVSLPKQLPTPLKTLQKACPEKTFEEGPAHCPAASQVAQAKVSTPVLPGGLSGTAYFVSHGGARYPELIIVLEGENGVTVQVHGETFISKAGVTTGTFSTVPDVPFTNFELTFPQRQYPAFTATGNLCKETLKMPTEIIGQNGDPIRQSTKIVVTGCPKRRTPKRNGKGKKRAKG